MTQQQKEIAVLKFGSSVLRSERDVDLAVEEIYRATRLGHKVLAVVSAFGQETDKLLEKARKLSETSEEHALAAFLATGESASVAMVALALERAGICSRTASAESIRLLTKGGALDATPLDIDIQALDRLFARHTVVVVPGFVGRNEEGLATILGRGGSDLTAVFLAHRLGAKNCKLLKDTEGVFESDPADDGPPPLRYKSLSWDDALAIDGQVLQQKALHFALANQVSFEVARPSSSLSSKIGDLASKPVPYEEAYAPTTVAILGLGKVGAELYRRLSARPERYQVIGVAVRDLNKHRGTAPDALLTTDALALARRGADVVIEVLGGFETASTCIETALDAGSHVVSANKEVVAKVGERLIRKADTANLTFLYSAAVGASLPVLENIRALQGSTKVTALAGILNGTTNFLLDELKHGGNFKDALEKARDLGFAEALPDDDVEGKDAARKLVIVAQEIFGRFPDRLEVEGMGHLSQDDFDAATRKGQCLKQVARLWQDGDQILARVSNEALSAGSFLARTQAAENRILITTQEGHQRGLRGQGAGPAPTTEALVADLLDLRRSSRAIIKNDDCLEAGA